MNKKIIFPVIVIFFVFTSLLSKEQENISQSQNNKKIYIYFMGEEAGYEEYEWIEQVDKYVLSVKGEMTKPISLITSQMTIEVDKEFKPLRFYFKGIVNGVNQEIETTVSQGEASVNLKAGQQTREMTATISSDALFLPNGIFSPYVVVAKKIKELAKEKLTLPAYIVPQIELSMIMEPDRENPHLCHLHLAGVKIELLTDEEGYIKSLSIPSQSIEVYEEKVKKEEPSRRKEGIHHELIIRGSKLGKGFYSLQTKEEDILIKGETQQVIGQVSLNLQFEEKLSSDWNLKEAILKGKVNDEEVELRGKVEEDRIKVFLKQGKKISEKQMPYTSDVIFSTENSLLDNLLLVKKISHQQKKKIYALTKSWGSFYIDEPIFIPITIEKEGEEILKWQGKEMKTERYFIDLGGSSGGYIWAKEDNVLKISFPFAAMDVYHQDYVNLKTKEIASPEIDSDKYISEEVSYPSGKIKLAGTLTIPKDNRSKHPAAILISGSGPQDRNEDTVGPGGLKFGIFKQIAHRLSENGIAVLRYDDRGVGKSEGNFSEAAHPDLIQDVKAGVEYLRARDDILDDRIVLIGHSDGAIVAPRVAAEDPKIKAIVLLAGTAETGDMVLREQFNFLLDRMELSEGEKEKSQANYENLLKIIKGEPVEKEIEEKLKSQIEPQLKWLQSFVSYDPLSILDKVNALVLIINGGKDKQVFPHHAQKLYQRLTELNKNVRLKIFPDLNHLLIPSQTGAYSEYAKQTMEGKRLSQELLSYLLGWLHGVLFVDLML